MYSVYMFCFLCSFFFRGEGWWQQTRGIAVDNREDHVQ